ncbi:Huntingtin-Interacting Protein 1-Related Protein [Manis pentadactyla]|nr:Huntingtin-Interacting Protein 1-Related Protein [Manis pentadactyla]
MEEPRSPDTCLFPPANPCARREPVSAVASDQSAHGLAPCWPVVRRLERLLTNSKAVSGSRWPLWVRVLHSFS